MTAVVIAVAATSLLGGGLLLAWSIGQIRSTPSFAEARLASAGRGALVADGEAAAEAAPFVRRVVLPALAGIGRRLSSSRSLLDDRAERLRRAGIRVGAETWVGIEFGALLAGLPLGAAAGYLSHLAMPFPVMLILAGLILGRISPRIYLDRRVRARQREIANYLPDCLELIVMLVEAGMGMPGAISEVARKYETRWHIGAEFAVADNEIRLGTPFAEALRHMADRTGVEDLDRFVTAITIAQEQGNSIAPTLRSQAREARIRRRQRAEEQAQKAPLKMLFPMIGCIFPVLFVVLLGPAAIQVYHQFVG